MKNFGILHKLVIAIFLLLSIGCFLFSMYFWNQSQLLSQPKQKEKQAIITIVSPTLSPQTTTISSQKNIISTSAPTITETVQPPKPTTIHPTDAQTQIIEVQLTIEKPDGTLHLSVPFHSGLNPCSLLTEAKNANKISSLTILHYGAPLNSDYVKEINGLSDNWVFSINGSSKPSGCSNYEIQTSDTIQWKFN